MSRPLGLPEITHMQVPHDPASIDADTYHAVIGPALEAAAKIAAERGDPTLAADMPAMLALIELINHLSAYHQDQASPKQADREWLNGAPAAACVMVMQQAKLEQDAIGQCLAALETAYAQLAEHQVTAPALELIRRGCLQLQAGERKLAATSLQQATRSVVSAIEAWREQTH